MLPLPRLLTALLVTGAAAGALTASAGADSIVYVKNGNVWLTSPDATKQYQVTFDGGYCVQEKGVVVNPTWSQDSGRVAYGSSDGVHVMAVPAALDCNGLADQLLVAGGGEPDWGPADVNMAQRPSPSASGSAGAQGRKPVVAGPGLRKLKLTPSAFRARAGAKLRFTLAGPAKLTLTVRRANGKAVKGALKTAGRPGANILRFKGRIGGHTLRPGRYRLTISARAMVGAGTAKATTAFRIVR